MSIILGKESNGTAVEVMTHGGTFHADEVMATAILVRTFGTISVSRVFNVPEDLPEESIVYDIGGGRFDHHQKGGNGMRENEVPYSSAGLIWKEFGPQILKDTLNPEKIWRIADSMLIQGIDAVDNGSLPKTDYPASPMSISRIISMMNPRYDETVSSDEKFAEAVELAGKILDMVIQDAVSTVSAEQIVEEAIESADGAIMVLSMFVPWQSCLLHSDNLKAQKILYVIFPSNRGGYNCQAVPDKPGSTSQRKALPESWRGLSGLQLQEMTGVQSATFCHNAGFMCGAATLDDAVALAKLACEA